MKKLSLAALILALVLLLASCGGKEVSGKLEYTDKAKDSEFGVEVDAPILVRCVEMVQNYKDENGERLVLSNKKLESEVSASNPDFPEDVKEAIFCGEVKLNGTVLSEDAVKAIVYSETVVKNTLNELPKNGGNAFGLVYKDGAYVSASDEWKAGEIRVSYYYISEDDAVSVLDSFLK